MKIMLFITKFFSLGIFLFLRRVYYMIQSQEKKEWNMEVVFKLLSDVKHFFLPLYKY